MTRRTQGRTVGSGAAGRELLAAVAHELRTPIAAVRGAASALAAGGDAIDGPTRARLLGVIDAATAQLGRLAQDLLDAGRLDAGRLDVVLGPCDAAEVAREVVASAGVATAAGGRLSLEETTAVPAVTADRGRLVQVLGNLVDNALRHGAGTVTVRLAAADGVIAITVADRGPGIPAQARGQVFEPYARLPGGAADGTGLGLHLARELVRAMGGDVTVAATPGGGATFTVALPVWPQDGVAPADPPPP